MTRITPCLWYDGNAEEAASFYASIFPDSSVDAVNRAPTDYPNGKAGDVLTVSFTVLGQKFLGLNGGPAFKFNEAVEKITANGGTVRNGPMEVPGGAWIVQAADPQGAAFAVVGPRK